MIRSNGGFGGGKMLEKTGGQVDFFNALRLIVFIFGGFAALCIIENPTPEIFQALFIFSLTVCFDCYAYHRKLVDRPKAQTAICIFIAIYVIIAGISEALARSTTIIRPDTSRMNYYVIELNNGMPWWGGAKLDYLCLIIGGLPALTAPAIMTWILDRKIEKSGGNKFERKYNANKRESGVFPRI